MTTLPNREVGDDGHVDDHNNIAAAIASLEAALPVAQNAAASASAAAASAASALSSKNTTVAAQESAETAAANSLLYSQQAAASAAAVANEAVNAAAVEAAKTAAEAAQAAAEAAQTGAETAESNAGTSATAAAGSASTAASEATAAASSATAAAGSESAAATSATAAAGSASAASTSATAASGSASAASASESAAAASESAAAASAASAASSAASVDATATTAVEFRQFAADGSVLSNLPARVHPAEQLLKQAVWWIDAAHSSAGDQSIKNLGWGGSALDAQVGSSGSADSNDPKYLAWEGENYVYLPGVAGNYLSVPDEAALDITGDLEVVMKIKPGRDWNVSSWASVYKREAWWFYHNYSSVNGQLTMAWRSGGLNKSVNSTVAVSANLGAAASVGWVKGTLDVDDGAGNHVVKFWTSPDGVTWTQLGTTVTTAGTTSIDTSTYEVKFGDLTPLTSQYYTGDLYRAIVKDGIDGTPVLDVDCSQITSGSNTSFTALTGQTVTINRSTSGRKTVGVVHPRWLFGTDDYMEVPDNDLLDFGASDSFTVLAVARQMGNTSSDYRFVDKADYMNLGWTLRKTGDAIASIAPGIDDGPNSASLWNVAPFTPGSLAVVGMRVDRSTQTLSAFANGAVSASTASTASVGSIANSLNMRVGGNATGAAYADMEFTAAAIWRRALTAGEIATLNSYFQGRDA